VASWSLRGDTLRQHGHQAAIAARACVIFAEHPFIDCPARPIGMTPCGNPLDDRR
jgi:hypothetical protein